MGEIRYPPGHQPTPIEAKAFQLIADGLNMLGYANRGKLKRKNWHRVALWIRWTGRRQLEVADVAIVEDRTYAPE